MQWPVLRVQIFWQDPDPEKNIPDPISSRFEMNLKSNYFEKQIKFDKFSSKMLIKI